MHIYSMQHGILVDPGISIYKPFPVNIINPTLAFFNVHSLVMTNKKNLSCHHRNHQPTGLKDEKMKTDPF